MTKRPPLSDTHPEIAKQWDIQENLPLTPNTVTAGSNQVVSWLGACTHQWNASVKSRTRGSGCPYCTNRKVLVGFNDLSTTHPEIAAQWHPELNEEKPSEVSAGMGKLIWWQCNRGHEWRTAISDRKKHNCPYCSGNKVLVGFNDLTTTHTSVAEQWHPTKNGATRANEYSAGSNYKKWWLCNNGHIWYTQISHRTQGKGCPTCTGRNVLRGSNDLETTHPSIASQWHPQHNHLAPYAVTHGSHYNAWWLCSQGHEWQAPVYSRTEKSEGCLECASRKFVSQGEVDLKSIITTLLSHTGNSIHSNTRHAIPPLELDVYIPTMRLAVEFNGLYWHSEKNGKDRNYHARKSQAASEKGIHLIHVWEDDWRERRDIVVRNIAHRLGATERLSEPGVLLVPDESLTQHNSAEALTPTIVNTLDASKFLQMHHLLGETLSANIHLGLRDNNGELLGLMSIRSEGIGATRHIERYATKGVIYDGFRCLLDYASSQIDDQTSAKLTTWVILSDSLDPNTAAYIEYGFTSEETTPQASSIVHGLRVPLTDERVTTKPIIWDSGGTQWSLDLLAN